MKIIDILKQKHTVLMSMDGWHNDHQGLSDYTQKDLRLNDIIFHLGNKFKDTINEMRNKEYHSKDYNNIKEHCLPVWFVGGTFPFQKTEDKDIISYSNILSIDIDNQDIDRKAIYNLPYVIGVLKSSGGLGYYVLILVEDGQYTKEYYSYLAKLFKQKFNITIDEQCKNIGRKRVLSYEDNIWEWIKPIDYDVKPWKLKETVNISKEVKIPTLKDYNPILKDNNNILFTRKAIWKLLNNGYSIDDYNLSKPYYAWFHTACEFRHFDDGEDMFLKFSKNSVKYHDAYKDIIKKWNQSNKEGDINDICKKWSGICKNKFGKEWWKELF